MQKSPLIASGVLLGAGLGGFVDGIVLHQMLQWHNMISSKLPPLTLVDAKINMFWDGAFHAGVWMLTFAGIWMLFRAGKRADCVWSGRVLGGAMLAGWGLFNLVEGIIDHQILGLHHVHDLAPNRLVFDLAFLLFGAVLVGVGALLVKSERASE